MGENKNTKVTLDTNILVSGLGWKGNPHKILEKVIRGEIQLFTSREIYEELSRVLDYPSSSLHMSKRKDSSL